MTYLTSRISLAFSIGCILPSLMSDPALCATPVDKFVTVWKMTLNNQCENIAEASGFVLKKGMSEEHAEAIEIGGTIVGYVICRFVVPSYSGEKTKVFSSVSYNPTALNSMMKMQDAGALNVRFGSPEETRAEVARFLHGQVSQPLGSFSVPR